MLSTLSGIMLLALDRKTLLFRRKHCLIQESSRKTRKNNNMFENMAFYDSVAVIAGRAIVTIDPLPENNKEPVVQQPRRLREQEQFKGDTKNKDSSASVLPTVIEISGDESTASNESQKNMIDKEEKVFDKKIPLKKSVSFVNVITKTNNIQETAESNKENTIGGTTSVANNTKTINTLTKPDVESRKKSLRERRMSKSLYLKIDFPKEVPIIRQNSMPKFFLETPHENQTESTLVKSPLNALKSPMISSSEFSYDLYSVVQIEKSKNQNSPKDVAQIHRSPSRLSQIKEKIKLRKSKSTLSSSSIPHSNYI